MRRLYNRNLVGAKIGFSTTTQSDYRSRIEQPVRWGAGCGGVVRRYRFAGRDRKHSSLSTNLPRKVGTGILGLLPCRCTVWVILAISYCNWLYPAWALGFVPLSIRLFSWRHVDNRHSTGLRYLLLRIRFRGRGLSHDK